MILVVDDKPENIFSLKRTLEYNHFEVDTAYSGNEALKKILQRSYSLIILDVQMPGMDGFEVAEALSGYSKAKDIPIIFLSAVNTDKKFIAKGYTSGGVDYVTKPVDPDIFMLKVKTLHRLYEQNRELNNIRDSLLEEVEVRKTAEEALNKKVHELHSILEAMPQITFTTKGNGEIEYVNEHWFLYSDQIAKMPDFHPGDACILHKWTQAKKLGTTVVSEVRIRNIITGAFRYHLLRIIPIKHENIVVKWVGTFTDIHEQKMANETLEHKVTERTQELLKKNQELEASNHELQQFASVASHDLQEPLRKIQVFSSILRDRFMKENDEGMRNMDRIIASSQRMGRLIDDLLNYSRLSLASLFQKTDLNDTIAEILTDLEFIIRDKDAQVHIHNIPVIDAIPGQMRQVFQNLISNSLKFSRKEEQPVININAELIDEKSFDAPGVAGNGSYYRITVSDNGIGFDEKYLTKIFAMFQRLNPREAYEGTGIGLAIVKKIIDKHNGLITAHSQEGHGATFVIVLPLEQTFNKETVEI